MRLWRMLQLNILVSVAAWWRRKAALNVISRAGILPRRRRTILFCREDYAAAEDWGTVIAIVHSHPDATTQPSELDKAQCDATLLPWHIVSWPEGDLRTIQPRGELPLLERPFVLGHFDCWGLVMSYFRQTHGIELHDYRVDYPWWENDYPDNFYQDCWYECGFREFDGPPKPGDMVIMQVQADKWNHAGILLEGNMLLHHCTDI
jgi:cell wall-associated NlpC family hydrolase